MLGGMSKRCLRPFKVLNFGVDLFEELGKLINYAKAQLISSSGLLLAMSKAKTFLFYFCFCAIGFKLSNSQKSSSVLIYFKTVQSIYTLRISAIKTR